MSLALFQASRLELGFRLPGCDLFDRSSLLGFQFEAQTEPLVALSHQPLIRRLQLSELASLLFALSVELGQPLLAFAPTCQGPSQPASPLSLNPLKPSSQLFQGRRLSSLRYHLVTRHRFSRR